jgi:hypothetical protein
MEQSRGRVSLDVPAAVLKLLPLARSSIPGREPRESLAVHRSRLPCPFRLFVPPHAGR